MKKLVLALLILAGTFAVLAPPVHWDSAIHLYVAEELLKGKELYVDLLEINPPAIYLINIPVVWIAKITGMSELGLYSGFVLLICFAVLVLCARLARRMINERAVLYGVMMAAAFVMLAVPMSNVGLRVHLAATLALPYMFLAATRVMGRSVGKAEAVLAGVLAGVGLGLKPYFLIVAVAVEGMITLHRRWSWKRPELLGLTGYLAGYGVLVLLLFPEYIPWALEVRKAYAAFSPAAGVSNIVLSTGSLVALVSVASAIPSGRLTALRRVSAAATAAFWLALVVQGKGWDYHWVPVHVLGAFTLLLALLEVRHVRRHLLVVGVALVAATMLVARSNQQKWEELADYPQYLPQMIRIVEEAPPGPVASLSAGPHVAFPLVNLTGREWGLSFLHLWPAWAAQGSVSEMSPFGRFFFERTVEDLVNNPPAVLVVHRPVRGTMDWLAYFARDSRFRALIQEYRLVAVVGEYGVFEPQERR